MPQTFEVLVGKHKTAMYYDFTIYYIFYAHFYNMEEK